MGAPGGCKQHGRVWARGRKVLVGTGRAISAVFGINGLRKVAVLPCRASISSVHGPFFSYGRLVEFSGGLIASLLIGGCG